MEHLPIFMNLRGRRALVVGAGSIAARKAALLLAAGARVTMVAPRCSAAAAALCAAHAAPRAAIPARPHAGEADVSPDGVDRIKAAPQEERASQRYGTVPKPGLTSHSEDVGEATLEWIAAEYTTAHLHGCTLVIAATNRRDVNERVAGDADARSIPVNVADQPDLCRFILPAIVERGPVTIAIGSGGRAPVLVRRLRARLESLIPIGYGWLAELAGRLREPVGRVLPDVAQRRAFWERTLDGPVAQLALNGALNAAETRLRSDLEAIANDGDSVARPVVGEVYLIGVGPGDPDLMTFKALRLLQQADVIVHDRLVAREVIDLGRREADRICVGKQRDRHALPQVEINALLVDLARQGKKVARLKGGDPFIFGRGGEELEALATAGIPAQVVPGVTAASGCAAYAGIPLTHREHADSVRLLTGQTRDGRFQLDGVAAPRSGSGSAGSDRQSGGEFESRSRVPPSRETLVIYMGLAALPDLAAQLVEHGHPDITPVAVVSNGTTPRQRVVCGTLTDIATRVARAGIESPALIIVGAVAALTERLAWFRPDVEAAASCHFPQVLPRDEPAEPACQPDHAPIPA